MITHPPEDPHGSFGFAAQTAVFFREQINQSVRPLTDIADPLVEILQDRFATQLPQLFVEYDAFNGAAAGNPAALPAHLYRRTPGPEVSGSKIVREHSHSLQEREGQHRKRDSADA
jgi:hypothetical protein